MAKYYRMPAILGQENIDRLKTMKEELDVLRKEVHS